ncbi:MAG TPA: HI0074 family nucleotidyltransferase substrate-binding subunit [Anaerolineales bacterium]|nr:HI0074 family nucleotidyltransferase substrate-binding subunit [Anaerolineales bacterium]HLO33035.1 HI0074 family nucleotidyltransferase substrate-binding subunit [Anaerolineales bacterium]
MERVRERITIARRALATLEAVVGKSSPSDIERDAAIQRFEYTFEAVWKAAQSYLREMEGLDNASPRAVIRSSFQSRLIDEKTARAAMNIVTDRNLTVHTYNEKFAMGIYKRLSKHAKVIEIWLSAMEKQIIDL